MSNSNYSPIESLTALEQKYIKANLAKAFDKRYSSQVLAVCDKKHENILPGIKIC